MQPRLTIHASPAASSTTTSSAVRPEGNDSVTVRSHCGPLRGRALLIESLALGAVDEALEHDRTVREFRPERPARPTGSNAPGRVSRLSSACEKYSLSGMRHADFASVDREHLGGFFFLHKNRLHQRELLRLGAELPPRAGDGDIQPTTQLLETGLRAVPLQSSRRVEKRDVRVASVQRALGGEYNSYAVRMAVRGDPQPNTARALTPVPPKPPLRNPQLSSNFIRAPRPAP